MTTFTSFAFMASATELPGSAVFHSAMIPILLKDLGLRINELFFYEYDFTDGWQHLIRVETMRITVMCQMARGLGPPGSKPRESALKELKRIKWYLWNGNTFMAIETVSWLSDDIFVEDLTRYL